MAGGVCRCRCHSPVWGVHQPVGPQRVGCCGCEKFTVQQAKLCDVTEFEAAPYALHCNDSDLGRRNLVRPAIASRYNNANTDHVGPAVSQSYACTMALTSINREIAPNQ
jgi:hypothetical protein